MLSQPGPTAGLLLRNERSLKTSVGGENVAPATYDNREDL